MNSKSPISFLISGGGTGGHIFPAIAIGNALRNQFPNAVIEFVGASDKMEMQKVPEAGFKIYGLWISGLQRKLTLSNAMFPFKVIHSVVKSLAILRKTKPSVVIGVGGFASGPLLFAANLLGIPTLIQEQNSYPGITNKILAGKVNKICVAFDKMERFFPKDKIVVTGNPIRQDILSQKDKVVALKHFGLRSDLPCVLIIGGSLGARTINEAIADGMSKFKNSGIQILWQTGKNFPKQDNVPGNQTEFIREMDLAYSCADVVVSRAGASSLSEICALGKVSILVPSPNVAEDHQTKNAMALVEKNAAKLVKDKEANEVMVDEAIALVKDADLCKAISEQAKAMSKPNATKDILQEIIKLIKP